MPFDIIEDKARKDALGPQLLDRLWKNLLFERGLFDKEHIISTGEHNALEVPRVCRLISGTTVSPSSSDITSVTNPATGKYVLTLAGGRFDTDMRPQVNVRGDGTKPYLYGVNVVSATSVEVYIQKLSSALGAGNTWAAANCDFDIALHSTPLSIGSWNDLPGQRARGDTLDDSLASTSTWNTFVQESANLNAAVMAEHATTGVHSVRQVARYAGQVRQTAASTFATYGTYTLASATWHATGWVIVSWASALTNPISFFTCPDYSRLYGGTSSDLTITYAAPNTTTSANVFIFKFDGTNWSAYDSDFFLAVHGS